MTGTEKNINPSQDRFDLPRDVKAFHKQCSAISVSILESALTVIQLAFSSESQNWLLPG